MLYTKPGRYVCEECGGIASYPNPHNPTCIYRGTGMFAMSPRVATIRAELEIADGLAERGEVDWRDLCQALLKNLADLLTGLDFAAMGRPAT